MQLHTPRPGESRGVFVAPRSGRVPIPGLQNGNCRNLTHKLLAICGLLPYNCRVTAITNTSGQAETGRFLSVAKVKDELGCSREHVYDLIEAGALVAIRLGTRKFSVSRESLEAYIAQHTYKPAPQPEAQQ